MYVLCGLCSILQLFAAIRKVMQPNVVHFAPLDLTAHNGNTQHSLTTHFVCNRKTVLLLYSPEGGNPL